VVITRWVPNVAALRFSYQAILSSFEEAESTSASPSPSRSVANTLLAPSAWLVITCWVPKTPSPWILVPGDLVVASRGGEHIGVPVAVQVRREHAPGEVGLGGDDLLAAEVAAAEVLVPGDLVVDRGGGEHIGVPVAVQIRGNTDSAPSAWVVMTCWLPKLPPPRFSYQAILLS
jgi:hypothetical protein